MRLRSCDPRLDQFISDKTCDEVILDGEFTLKGMRDWPDSDRRKLARVRNIVNNPQGQPQFIFFYLVSSHVQVPVPSGVRHLQRVAGHLAVCASNAADAKSPEPVCQCSTLLGR